MTREQAIEIVKRYLYKHQPTDYRLNVFPEATHEEDGWWIVAVGPDRSGIRRYDYYDRLAQTEREIEDNEAEMTINLTPPPPSAATGH